MFKAIQTLLINWLVQNIKDKTYPLSDFDRIRYEARLGDVILVEGRSRISKIIKRLTTSSWSHAALYVGKIQDIEDKAIRKKLEKFYPTSKETPLVLEGMLGQGTILSPLANYRDDHLRLCRPTGLSMIDAYKVLSYGATKLGQDYDMSNIFMLLLLAILPTSLVSKTWLYKFLDLSENYNNTAKTICSATIAEAFASVNFPILPEVYYIDKQSEQAERIIITQRHHRLFIPKDFDHSPYFNIIKHPIIDLRDQAIYRKLPWVSKNLYTIETNYQKAKLMQSDYALVDEPPEIECKEPN